MRFVRCVLPLDTAISCERSPKFKLVTAQTLHTLPTRSPLFPPFQTFCHATESLGSLRSLRSSLALLVSLHASSLASSPSRCWNLNPNPSTYMPMRSVCEASHALIQVMTSHPSFMATPQSHCHGPTSFDMPSPPSLLPPSC